MRHAGVIACPGGLLRPDRRSYTAQRQRRDRYMVDAFPIQCSACEAAKSCALCDSQQRHCSTEVLQ
jgi:hypothetical protein